MLIITLVFQFLVGYFVWTSAKNELADKGKRSREKRAVQRANGLKNVRIRRSACLHCPKLRARPFSPLAAPTFFGAQRGIFVIFRSVGAHHAFTRSTRWPQKLHLANPKRRSRHVSRFSIVFFDEGEGNELFAHELSS